MARIRNWGTLTYSAHNSFGKTFDEEYWVWLVIELDKPIEVKEEWLRDIRISREVESFDISDLIGNTLLTIKNKEVALRGTLSGMLPGLIVKALTSQGTFQEVEVLLDQCNRFCTKDSNSCDVGINVLLTERVKYPDKFLQSFARKLNSWLAKVKTTK